MADPTPAQLAKARAIAGQVTAPCYDDTCDGRGCDRHTAITTIAAALADEAQQARPDATAQERHLALAFWQDLQWAENMAIGDCLSFATVEPLFLRYLTAATAAQPRRRRRSRG